MSHLICSGHNFLDQKSLFSVSVKKRITAGMTPDFKILYLQYLKYRYQSLSKKNPVLFGL